MKKLTTLLVSTLITLSSFNSAAQSAVEHASQGSRHSALASAHSTVAVGQVASGIVAVPLLIVGSTAVVSGAAGVSLLDAASGNHAIKHNAPLEVSDIIITADRSPAEQMKADKKVN